MTNSTFMLSSRSLVRVVAPLLGLVLLGAGCGTASTTKGPDGGMWKTIDGGKTWINKRALVNGAKVTADAAKLSVVDMVMDPQDNNTIYLATAENGLVYSLDAGDSWQVSRGLSTGRINAIAVDPKNKCTVYATRANEIFKTETCGRDWSRIYFYPRTDKTLSKLVVDWFNPTVLYAGTNDGDILKSTNSASSFEALKRIDGTRITSIVLDPRDSRNVFVATFGEGLWKSDNSGSTWIQIKKQFSEEFAEARRATQVVLDPKNSNILYIVSKYGIIRSDDQGATWKALNLVTPPNTSTINALAIDPNNSSHLIYTGPNTLVSSVDGGATWAAKKPPTTQVGSKLLIDPKSGDVVYLGTIPAAK